MTRADPLHLSSGPYSFAVTEVIKILVKKLLFYVNVYATRRILCVGKQNTHLIKQEIMLSVSVFLSNTTFP
jgi:hypothetical protein